MKAYAKAAGLFSDGSEDEADYSDIVEIDLSSIQPSVAGPKRPQDLVGLDRLANSFRKSLTDDTQDGGFGLPNTALTHGASVTLAGQDHRITHGSVVIAAITSCTNTSNPTVMIGAGLLARNARRLGLTVPGFVKTSMAPGSKLVRDYLQDAQLMEPLQELGFILSAMAAPHVRANPGQSTRRWPMPLPSRILWPWRCCPETETLRAGFTKAAGQATSPLRS